MMQSGQATPGGHSAGLKTEVPTAVPTEQTRFGLQGALGQQPSQSCSLGP